MTMTIYIAGPMSGYESFNKPSFQAAERYLKSAYVDAEIINPATLDEENGMVLTGKSGNEKIPKKEKETIIRRSIDAVFDCTHLYMLKGWEKSVGASGEHAIGVWLDREVLYEE